MTTTAPREPMSKKQTGDQKPAEGGQERRLTTTKVRSELIRKAKTVAAYRDMDLIEYIDQLLTPLVERDYRKIVRED